MPSIGGGAIWLCSVSLRFLGLVRVVWLESGDDTGDLWPCHIFLAVPDPSGKVGTLPILWEIHAHGWRVVGSSFQHAVVRSINDKNAQLQKQLENLVREGNYCFFAPPIETDKK